MKDASSIAKPRGHAYSNTPKETDLRDCTETEREMEWVLTTTKLGNHILDPTAKALSMALANLKTLTAKNTNATILLAKSKRKNELKLSFT